MAIGLHALAALVLADLGLRFLRLPMVFVVGVEFCGFVEPQFR